MTKTQTKIFENVYKMATLAGRFAGDSAQPTPMIVTDDIPATGRSWYVPEGACGFAWVTIKPGTGAFAKWLAKKGLARKGYYGGMEIWISEFGQSMERKEAYARAMAEVFKTELGVNAYAGSRMN